MNSEDHGRILLDLARGLGRDGSGRAEAFSRATEASAGVVGVERVGIWLFDDARTKIVCADLFRQSAGAHESGAILHRDVFPAYFEALETERIVAAEDATSDRRTREFTESYLRPNGIGAMLDAPIFHAGELTGVVCHEHLGGTRIWTVEDRSFAASVGDFVGVVIAEHERRETAGALEHSERRFRMLAENSTEMVTELDARGTLLYVSPSHSEGVGYSPEELVGTNAFEFVHPDDRASVVAAIRGGFETKTAGAAAFRYRHRDGHWLWLEGHGRVFLTENGESRAVVSTRDVTARVEAEKANRELEAQISQMQRLESVGQLAGGVAHDFNNLLTAMLGHVEAAEEKAAAGRSVDAELSGMTAAVERAASLTQQLLSLARNQAIDPKPTDVGRSVASLVQMIRRVIGEDIELEVDLDDDLPTVLIDPTQLDQILMNLVVNCRDAMPEGGRLTIRGRRELIRPGASHTQLGGRDGRHACIEVSDTGLGMEADTLGRAFDPFFTTKEPGRGTGLGLATVYSVVRQASGGVEIQSKRGEGTTVSIRLPAHETQPAGPRVASVPRSAHPELAGTERILLVEDDEFLRGPLEIATKRHGYDLVTARNGIEALERLRELGDDVDLVVSDVVMPGMGGLELAHTIAREHPGVKVMLISGYAPPLGDRDGPVPCDAILRKPFAGRQFVTEIRAVLDRPRASPR